MKNICLFVISVFFLLINCNDAFAQEKPTEQEARVVINNWLNNEAWDGLPEREDNQFVAAMASFIESGSQSCTDDDIQLLYDIPHFATQLFGNNALESRTSVLGLKSLIQGAHCEMNRLRAEGKLSLRYSEYPMGVLSHPNAPTSSKENKTQIAELGKKIPQYKRRAL